MNKRYASVGLLVLLILFGVLWKVYAPSGTTFLPPSFSMRVYGDFTSSGGSRVYEAILVAEGGVLSGKERYRSSNGGGSVVTITCVIKDGRWVLEDKSTDLCDSVLVSIPTTVYALNESIIRGELVAKETCRHSTLCYELIP